MLYHQSVSPVLSLTVIMFVFPPATAAHHAKLQRSMHLALHDAPGTQVVNMDSDSAV